ncbi:hypothetical protein BJY52DRAFT_643922 [Lactarius psammicola]|nr:hypothetical protein BJY52DRAFT_643922 [Lactarius psammicola]
MSALGAPGAAFIRTDDKNIRLDAKLAGKMPEIRDFSAGMNSPDVEMLWFPCIIGDLSSPLPRGVHGLTLANNRGLLQCRIPLTWALAERGCPQARGIWHSYPEIAEYI